VWVKIGSRRKEGNAKRSRNVGWRTEISRLATLSAMRGRQPARNSRRQRNSRKFSTFDGLFVDWRRFPASEGITSFLRLAAVTTEMLRALLMTHRQQEQLVKFRTMEINGLRGMLPEFGEAMGKSRTALGKAIPDALPRVEECLPKGVIDTLRVQWTQLEKIDEESPRLEGFGCNMGLVKMASESSELANEDDEGAVHDAFPRAWTGS
jgi:hypothetical protein